MVKFCVKSGSNLETVRYMIYQTRNLSCCENNEKNKNGEKKAKKCQL